MDEYFSEVLSIVHQRMSATPMHDYLKRHLLSVYLTAMAYNPTITLKFLE